MRRRIVGSALAAVLLSACGGGSQSALPPSSGSGSAGKTTTVAFTLKVPGGSVQTAHGRRPLYISRDTKGIGIVFQAHAGSGYANATSDTAPSAGMAIAPGAAGVGAPGCTALGVTGTDGSYSCTVYIAGVPVGYDDFRFTLWNAAPASCASNGTGCTFTAAGDKPIAVQTLNDYGILQGLSNAVPLTATFYPVVDSVAVTLSGGITDGASTTFTANTVFKDAQGDIIIGSDQLLDDTGANLTATLNIGNDGAAPCTVNQIKANSCSLYFGTSGSPAGANPTISTASDPATTQTITYDGVTAFPTSGAVPQVSVSPSGPVLGSNIAASVHVTSSASGSLGVPAVPQLALHPSLTLAGVLANGSDNNLYVEHGGALFAYVANYNSNNVSVIDTATNTVSATVPVGSHPQAIATTPDGTHAYVANSISSNVSVIDTATNTVSATVHVGSEPDAVAITPNGQYAYVANFNSGTVSVIATATNTVSTTVSVGSLPQGIAITPDGTHVYVANSGSSNVSVIATATNTVSATVNVGNTPDSIAITPDGTHAYVANYNSSNVSVIATATNTVSATVSDSPNGPYGVAITPDGTHAYVANLYGGNVIVIATATNTVSATVNVGSGPNGLAITPDGTHAYVANSGDNNLSVIDTATNTVSATVSAGADPESVAIAATHPGITQVTSGGIASAMTLGSATDDAIGGLASGSDTYLWYTDTTANEVDEQAPCGSGCANTAATWATSGAIAGASLGAIAAAPDGNLWFADSGNGNLDDISANAIATVNTHSVAGISNANLAAGTFADGDEAVCYGLASNGSVGCRDLSTSTTSSTNYTLGDGGTITAMAFGPDGVLYVASSLNHVYGLIDSGVGSTVALDAGFSYTLSSAAAGITADSYDGNLWITEGTGKLARIAPASTGNPPATPGALIEYALGSVFNGGTTGDLTAITADQFGQLWTSDTGLNQLDQITIHS